MTCENNVCNGTCCQKFTLPYSLEIIKRAAQEGVVLNQTLKETQMLSEMLIPVQNEVYLHNGNRYFWYTCKNFNKDTRKCMVYDKRPVLCRTYPDGRKRCGSMLDGGCDMDEGTTRHKAVSDFKQAHGLPDVGQCEKNHDELMGPKKFRKHLKKHNNHIKRYVSKAERPEAKLRRIAGDSLGK